MTHPLIEAAAKRAAVTWLTVPGGATGRLAWCLWVDDALYVVTGPGEQDVAGLAEASEAVVGLRGDHGGRIVSWPASVRRVEPGGDDWQRIAPQLAAKRLNASGTAEALTARWAERCALVELRPAADPVEAGESLPAGSEAAPPRPNTATRPARRPFKLHRVRRPR